jgi:hypothetical protein
VIPLPLLGVGAARAFDVPVVWVKEGIGGGGWPSGLISDTKVQLRAPLYRSESIVFRDTYAGIGARFAVTPAFVDVGPRLSLAPIDIFDVDVQASWHGYYGTTSGLLPFAEPRNKLESQRYPRKEDAFVGSALSLSVSPTLKLALGPLVLIDSWTVERWHVDRPQGVTEPYVYEPYRDLVIAWDDTLVQQQASLMARLQKGDDGPLLWVGGALRDTWSVDAGDRSLSVGGVGMWRPGRSPRSTTLLLQVLPYLIDADRVGSVPNIQGQVSWTLDHPLRAASRGADATR